MAKHYRIRMSGAGNPRPRQRLVQVACAYCTRVFDALPYAYRRFCSQACYHAAEEMIGVRGNRIDRNQHEIIEALRACGAKVADLSQLGRGVPDLLVACRGVIYLVEVKNPKSAYGRQGLNKHQRAFVDQGWQVNVVTSVDDALILVRQ